ncbi:MAG: sodium:solute symporter family protein [Lachnospira sp.]|nr:sodium:solute symporter family protein [Lachnospira sp.]
MNIYFIGMCIAMAIYLIVGVVVSKKVKNANDFYVAGRRAPVILIAGSLIASYTSTGMFMGDAAQCYEGVFTPILIFAGMQSAGYIIGAIFFGRYLRRSNVLTIPEFFGKRFCSRKMRILAAITAIVMMAVYLLSVIQGIGTLMTIVTGVNYNVCIILTMVVLTILTVMSGSTGVLITDTIMASVFTVAVVIGVGFITSNAGGWFNAIETISSNADLSAALSWAGKPGPLYNTGAENVAWGLIYGIVWMSVCMVGPWQSSRYLMAKNEHAVVKSAPISAIGVFLLEFLVGISAVMVNVINPDITDSSHVMIWAAMNLMPKVLGVVLLTGVLSAGISSATTFLSLIGASVANDCMQSEGDNSIRAGRITMIIVAAVVLMLAVFNPPSIFWIMFLGGAVAASSWMPVAVASVFSKRVTKTGAFCGMLFGVIGCFTLKMYSTISGVTLPVYLDPSLVGIICNIIALVIGSMLTQVTDEEKEQRAALFIMPESEKDEKEMAKTLRWSKASMFIGVAVFVMLLVFWILPYLRAI